MNKYIEEINKIFVSREAIDYSLTNEILNKLSTADVEYIDDVKDMNDYFADADDELALGKRTLFLTLNKGDVLKKCPGSRGRVCCNYYIFSPVVNCPFDCSYCFLQEYMSCPAIIINVNIEEMLEKVEAFISAKPDYSFRIGTGETADSLALDELTGMGEKIVRSFWNHPNAVIELKTKSDKISGLPINQKSNVVIAWSLNPQKMIDSDERFAASLADRLSAAKEVISKGYRVAFHFDPVFHYPGWEADYKTVIEMLFKNVGIADVAWISMGTFRYQPSFKNIFNKRFKQSKIMLEEFVLCEDGKMRYLKFLRSEMFAKMKAWIQAEAKTDNVPFYMCMESREMWEKVFNGLPSSDANVGRIFHQM